MNEISVVDLSQTPQPCIIDVRSPGEFAAVHMDGAINIPLANCNVDAITKQLSDLPQRIYFSCQSGQRAQMAIEALQKQGSLGFETILVSGGIAAWQEAKLPVIKGKGSISIERQVRIGAGSLVAIGSALSYFVHPAYIAIPAFVGCGLVFAGVSNLCAMGLLLARMPWNR